MAHSWNIKYRSLAYLMMLALCLPAQAVSASETVDTAAAVEEGEDLQVLLSADQTEFGGDVISADFRDTRKLYTGNKLAIERRLDMRTAAITLYGLAGYREGDCDKEGGSDLYTYGIVLTIPEGMSYTATDSDTYTMSYDGGATSITYPGKIVKLEDTSVSMYWKEVAILKDGTFCDVKIDLSNFAFRLLPGQTIQGGEQYLVLYSEVLGAVDETGTPLPPEMAALSNPAPCACRWTEDGKGKTGIGISFDFAYSFSPSDGKSLEDHKVDRMVFYFMDLDRPDTDGNGYEGPYTESIEFKSGLIGPVYVSNTTYRDLYEYASLEWDYSGNYEDQDEAYTAWYDEEGIKIGGLYGKEDDGRLLNIDRIKSSKGMLYSASHHVSATADYNQSLQVGLFAMVDPQGFSIRWRGCMI